MCVCDSLGNSYFIMASSEVLCQPGVELAGGRKVSELLLQLSYLIH